MLENERSSMPNRILVVEDEKDVAMVLSKRLMDAGYEVALVPDATMAMTQCHEFKPDLIILDLLLPGGGGISVLKNIKLSTKTNLIPVLVLTGAKNEELKQSIHAIGVEGYFEKPYDAPELLAAIKLLMLGGRKS